MQEKRNMPEIIRLTTAAIVANEIGSDESLAYRFSYAGGISGLSFGKVQFDMAHNKTALEVLRACEFTEKEIDRLVNKTNEIKEMIERLGPLCDISDLLAKDPHIQYLNAKLATHKGVIDSYDQEHVEESVDHCVRLCEGSGLELTRDALVALIDYHNQFYMTPGGKIHTWLKGLGRTVTLADILDFKLNHTKWGKDRADDVNRRHANITRICAEKKGA